MILTSIFINGYCSSNQWNSFNLSTKRRNPVENSRGVFGRTVSTVCVVSSDTGITCCFTGIRAGLDGVAGFITGGRRKTAGRAARAPPGDAVRGTSVSLTEKQNEWKLQDDKSNLLDV